MGSRGAGCQECCGSVLLAQGHMHLGPLSFLCSAPVGPRPPDPALLPPMSFLLEFLLWVMGTCVPCSRKQACCISPSLSSFSTLKASLCPSRTLHRAQEWNTLGPVSIPPALGSISWRLCLFTSKMRSLCSTLPRKPRLCWDPGAAPDPGPEKSNPQRMRRPTSSTHRGSSGQGETHSLAAGWTQGPQPAGQMMGKHDFIWLFGV